MSRSQPPGDTGLEAAAEDAPSWHIDRDRHLSEWAALFRAEPRTR